MLKLTDVRIEIELLEYEVFLARVDCRRCRSRPFFVALIQLWTSAYKKIKISGNSMNL